MRKARAATAPKPRARAKPEAKKPRPASLVSGASSPSTGAASSSPAADLSFLFPASSPAAKPRTTTRASPLAAAAASPVVAAPASMATVADLRSLAAARLDALKRRLDALQGASVRDIEASHSRISKRVKMQTQGCLELAEEADKEHRKMTDKIAERCELVKTSYKKFVAEVQASTSRVCKVTVPEIAKSAERSIDGLRSRYNISATTAKLAVRAVFTQ